MNRKAPLQRNSLKKDRDIDIIANELMKKINEETNPDPMNEYLKDLEDDQEKEKNQILNRAKTLVSSFLLTSDFSLKRQE